MKKLRNLFLFILTALFTVACNKEDDIVLELVDTDYAAVTLDVYASDKQGKDLLDLDHENNLLKQGISITYCGKTYSVDENIRIDLSTRVYVAVPQEPYLRVAKDGSYYLCIGEWAGDSKWNDERIVIQWPDGSSNTLSFTLEEPGKDKAKFFLDKNANPGPAYRFTF